MGYCSGGMVHVARWQHLNQRRTSLMGRPGGEQFRQPMEYQQEEMRGFLELVLEVWKEHPWFNCVESLFLSFSFLPSHPVLQRHAWSALLRFYADRDLHGFLPICWAVSNPWSLSLFLPNQYSWFFKTGSVLWPNHVPEHLRARRVEPRSLLWPRVSLRQLRERTSLSHFSYCKIGSDNT